MNNASGALSALRRLSIAIAIAVVFLFGLATTVYLSLRSPEVTVPDVLGKDRFEAERILGDAGLNFRVRATRPSSELKADTVLFQLPRAGDVVKVGQTVAMDISRSVKEGEASQVVALRKRNPKRKLKLETLTTTPPQTRISRRKRIQTRTHNENSNSNGNRNANSNRPSPNKNANNGNANRPTSQRQSSDVNQQYQREEHGETTIAARVLRFQSLLRGKGARVIDDMNDRTIDIAPSILSADFSRLNEEIAAVERGGAGILHVDVMDGHFVPNITVGLPVVKSIARATSLPIDAHLMISEPGRYAEQFVEAGAKMVSVHVEADAHVHRTLASIKSAGALAGVVINPATPVESLSEALIVC